MMKQIILIISIIAIICINNANAQNSLANCKFGGVDYSAFNNKTEYSYNVGSTQYVWNVCSAAPSCVSGLKIQNVASCQYSSNQWRSTGLLSAGSFSKLPNNQVGAQITYGKGLNCKAGNARTTRVEMTCAQGKPITITGCDEAPPAGSCIYEVKLMGNAACPKSTTTGGGTDGGGTDGTDGGNTDGGDNSNSNGDKKPKKKGMGGGWAFIIFLVCATVVYIGVGCVVNAKVRHLHGKEIFPNYHFWSDTFPGLLKDGVLFIKSKVSKTPSGYQQV